MARPSTAARAGVAVLLLSSLNLLACGGGGDSTPPPTPTDQAWVVPDGATNLTTAAGGQVEAFTAGDLYVNAHTTGHAGGEIRGQLDVAGDVRLASLDTAQEGLTGAGFGAGILTIDAATREARGFVIASGLTSITNAHVHQAARGSTGVPVISLVSGGAKDLWVVPDGTVVTQEVADAFQAGTLYYNVHTAANANGEIRGQLDKQGTLRLCSLDGPQEPGGTSTELGAGIIAVDEATGAVSGFALTTAFGTTVTNAHVHGPAARGVNATPRVQMTFGPTLVVVPDGATALTTGAGSQVADFLAGSYYVNVHTTAATGGEIRGQLDKTGDVRVAALDGAQEVPAVTTTAFGAGLVAVDGSSGQVSGFIVTRGLVSPTIAHIHRQARGAAGGPITDLAK